MRLLVVTMLAESELPDRAELVEQARCLSVVGRHELDCLIEVPPGAPLGRRVPKEMPVVVAPVDNSPEDAKAFEEPYVGELELYVRRRRLWALVVASYCGLTELPKPAEIHPTVEVTGHVVIDSRWFKKGRTISRSPSVLSRRG